MHLINEKCFGQEVISPLKCLFNYYAHLIINSELWALMNTTPLDQSRGKVFSQLKLPGTCVPDIHIINVQVELNKMNSLYNVKVVAFIILLTQHGNLIFQKFALLFEMSQIKPYRPVRQFIAQHSYEFVLALKKMLQ